VVNFFAPISIHSPHETLTMAPMNPADFLRLLESHLRPLHVPFSRAALQAFVEACWPWMEDDPDIELWASRFLATDDVMTPA
jgi:hypothetical protein